ncbi:MAG: type 4a pilus biogenesis protein PilO [Firmicutes bacterium]|jgi:Tfp pilus assembly protein PilO|nr:type 4a pilus biogenesis protein PilO [Bacillota bacterium]HOB35192.1 type 4a pilus biogenesis protein PilO [Bacillota bacterium]HPZ90286.1 type 4a pilus biogenesis protein PilO [Bacillota bacterium]HQE01791.1 type 4a pilus biogenesis protein PilO [Bacillota bacterium]
MKTKLTTQQKWILAIIGVILVNVAVWMYGLSPAIGKVEAAREALSRREEEARRLQQRLEQLNAIDTEALEEQMAQYDVQIPQQGLLREFITELEAMAASRRLELGRINISEPSPRNPYLAVFITFSLKGNYFNVMDYIIALENHPRLLFIDTFRLSRQQSGVECSIDLVIYAEDFDPITPHDAPGRANPFE